MSKLLKRLNDNQNKVADTNGIMKLQAWDYGVAQDLTNKQITATVANASGFLFDIDIPSNGTEIDLDFKDSQLQKLTPDTYFIEIKVIDKDGDVSVFPTEGYATFTINKNLHATEGALVPQITFDTVLADVKTAMDKTVAEYVKTIAKGDKGDTGPTGKDGVSPVIQVNQLFNTEFTPDLEGWDSSETSSGVKTPYRQYIYQGSNMLTFDTRNQADKKYSSIKQTIPFATSGSNRVVSLSWWSRIAKGTDLYGSTHIRSYDENMTKLTDVAKTWDSSSSMTLQKFENVAIPDGAQFVEVTFAIREGYLAFLNKPMLVFDDHIGDYVQGNYNPVDTLKNTPRLNGNNIYVGDNSYMGTNTFMDGVTLNGKNVVNGLTDTDWLDIPLIEGRTGSAKYKISLGRIFVHLENIQGMSGIGSGDTGSIGKLPMGGSYYTREAGILRNNIVTVTCNTQGLIYISGTTGDTPVPTDPLYVDFTIL